MIVLNHSLSTWSTSIDIVTLLASLLATVTVYSCGLGGDETILQLVGQANQAVRLQSSSLSAANIHLH